MDFVSVKFGVTGTGARAGTLEDAGIDSLGVVQLELKIKKLFGVVFLDGEIDAGKSLDEVITLTSRKLAEAGHDHA